MKNHKPWTITAKAKDEIEILLYEMIGMDFWTGEGTTAKSFAEDLKAAGDGIRKIHLRVNSPGGNVFDGLAIYNTLLSHGAKITAQVDGLSASIASVITMAASEISMGDNAMMMIHNPSTVVGGDAPEMRKMADTLDKVKTSMITSYRRHSKQSPEEIGALMDAETWMTAEETVENGFAEKVTTPEGDEADVAANFAPILAKFRKVPAQIAARFAAGTSRTKRVDGENLTSNCFIYVGDEEKTDTWHLPWHFAEEEKTKSHLRDALARFDQTEIPESAKPAARAKLVRLCKEHGITVSDSDKKTSKALARMIAQVRADKKKVTVDPMLCACDCTACLKDDCSACVNADCEDENCDDCPMQEDEEEDATARAKAAKARRARGVAIPDSPEAVPVERTECGCLCDPCYKDDNCKGCVNEDCRDENCIDCPMPKVRNERNEKDKQSRWMQRVGGELEQSATLTAAGTAALTARCVDAQTLRSEIRGRVTQAAKLLTAVGKEHAAEVNGAGKWTGRVAGELSDLMGLHNGVLAQITRQFHADSQSAQSFAEQIEAAEGLLTRLKAERAAALTALRAWTERIGGELQQSSTSADIVQKAALEEIARHAQSAAVLAEKIEAAETLLARLTSERASELTALGKWAERLSAELEQSGRLEASGTEGLSSLCGAASERITQLEADLAAARAAFAGERKSRLEESTAQLQWIARVKTGFEQAQQRYALVTAEVGRHAQAASHLASTAELRVANARTALLPVALIQLLEAEHKTRSEEAAAVERWTASRLAEFDAAAKLCAAALGELPHRLREAERLAEICQVRPETAENAENAQARAEARAAEAAGFRVFVAELQESTKLRGSVTQELVRRARLPEAVADVTAVTGQLKAEYAAEIKATAELAQRLTARLEELGKLQASAADEIGRRGRMAEAEESAVEIEAAGKLLATLKTQRAAAATAGAELADRLTKQLGEAGALHSSVAGEFSRRARLAESAQEGGEIGEQLQALEDLLSAIAELTTAVVAGESLDAITAKLEKASKMYNSVLEEIARRGRMLAL